MGQTLVAMEMMTSSSHSDGAWVGFSHEAGGTNVVVSHFSEGHQGRGSGRGGPGGGGGSWWRGGVRVVLMVVMESEASPVSSGSPSSLEYTCSCPTTPLSYQGKVWFPFDVL